MTLAKTEAAAATQQAAADAVLGHPHPAAAVVGGQLQPLVRRVVCANALNKREYWVE